MVLLCVAKKGDFTSEASPLCLGRAHKSLSTVGYSLSWAMERGGCGWEQELSWVMRKLALCDELVWDKSVVAGIQH